MAVARRSRCLWLHAGAVAWRGRALVLPGSPFAGKSTLVAALLDRGAPLPVRRMGGGRRRRPGPSPAAAAAAARRHPSPGGAAEAGAWPLRATALLRHSGPGRRRCPARLDRCPRLWPPWPVTALGAGRWATSLAAAAALLRRPVFAGWRGEAAEFRGRRLAATWLAMGSAPMPPEDAIRPATLAAWLLAAIRGRTPPSCRRRRSSVGLAEAAIAEGLAGVAAELPADWPGRVSAELLRQRQCQFAVAARLAAVEETLGATLAAAGCQALLLKGAALLRRTLSLGAAGRRPLERPRPADPAGRKRRWWPAALTCLGLRRLDPTRWRGDGLEIDFHHDLLGMDGPGSRRPLRRFRSTTKPSSRRSLPADPGGPAPPRLPAPEPIFSCTSPCTARNTPSAGWSGCSTWLSCCPGSTPA